MEWQPIESAPKDGKLVLVFVPSRNKILPATFGSNRKDGWSIWFSSSNKMNVDASMLSHWMPLPPPPKEF